MRTARVDTIFPRLITLGYPRTLGLVTDRQLGYRLFRRGLW